ncbi:MAG: hypothetical protein KAS05_04470, partial [Candidatus Omnitrophica bacterium]|nr:hypothetical protein [Candidatus Omnitrophota bacterium]
LNAILCKRIEHPLRNDFTIAHDKRLYQILDKTVGKKVTVEERISGAIYITCKGLRLKYKQVTVRLLKEKSKSKPRKINKPSMEHPWKKASYDSWISKKAHLQTKKPSEDLVLTEA